MPKASNLPLSLEKETHCPAFPAYQAWLTKRKEAGLFRTLSSLPTSKTSASPEQKEVGVGTPYTRTTPKENSFCDFTSNDYLGLSKHPVVIEATCKAAQSFGVGARASRLLYGTLALHEELEALIAQTKGQEAALLFPSGFQANSSVLEALLNKQILTQVPLVFSDRLNHASLHSGCTLAQAKQKRYQNVDLMQLEHALEAQKHEPSARPRFVLSETVFSMEGSQIDPVLFSQICTKHKAFSFLDEAHATGVLGKNGYGLSTLCPKPIDLVLGTFSKALGSQGGYVACSADLKDYLLNSCRGFIYTTGLSPLLTAAALASWTLIPNCEGERETLHLLGQKLRSGLEELGFPTFGSVDHIIPAQVGSLEKTVRLQYALAQEQIFVSAIRSPTVPKGQERLRFSLHAGLTVKDIERTLKILKLVL